MPSAIQTIFRDVSPFLVARDLGIPIKQQAGLHYIDHPHSLGSRLYLYRGELVSDKPGCGFVSGNIFDFLALHLGSYAAAVEHVLASYSGLADKNMLGRTKVKTELYTEELEAARRQFKAILGLRNNWRGPRCGAGMGWLSGNDLALDCVQNLVYIATGHELKALLLEFQAQTDRFVAVAATYIVFPYFSKFHCISKLKLVDLDSKRTGWVELSAAKTSYFGLPSVNLGNPDVRVFDEPVAALRHLSDQMVRGNPMLGVVHPDFGEGLGSSATLLPHGIYVAADTSDLSGPVRLRNAFERLEVTTAIETASAPGTPTRRPWLAHIQQVFQHQVEACPNEVTANVRRLIDDCRYDPVISQGLTKWAADSGHTQLVEAIGQCVSEPRIIIIGDREIEETETGYETHCKTTGLMRRLTNFTLRMYATVWFADSNDTYNYGILQMRGQEIHFKIDQEEMYKDQNIAVVLRNAVKVGSDGTSNLQPEIFSDQHNKLIGHIMRAQLNRFASVKGIKQLGWNKTRTLFDTPSWRTTIECLSVEARQPHPASEVLQQHFTGTPRRECGDISLITPQMRVFIALLASMLTRSYLRLDMPVVSVQTHDSSYALLRAMFTAFGQASPVDINVNKRRDIRLVPTDLADMPLYGVCNGSDGVEGQIGNIFAIGASGMPFVESIAPDTIEQVEAFTYQMVTQLTLWLQREVVAPRQALTTNPTTIQDYVMEGVRFIRQGTEFRGFDTALLHAPHLARLLASLTPTRLKYAIRVELNAGLLRINFNHLAGHSRNHILKELETMMPVSPSSLPYLLRIPRVKGMALIQSFFSKPVEFGIVNDSTDVVGEVRAQLG
jgi:hypothetical protein